MLREWNELMQTNATNSVCYMQQKVAGPFLTSTVPQLVLLRLCHCVPLLIWPILCPISSNTKLLDCTCFVQCQVHHPEKEMRNLQLTVKLKPQESGPMGSDVTTESHSEHWSHADWPAVLLFTRDKDVNKACCRVLENSPPALKFLHRERDYQEPFFLMEFMLLFHQALLSASYVPS